MNAIHNRILDDGDHYLLEQFNRAYWRLFYMYLHATLEARRNGEQVPRAYGAVFNEMVLDRIDMLEEGFEGPATPEISE